MPAGRPRKPTSVTVVQGTDQPDRRNEASPRPETVAPPPPDHLGEYASLHWAELAPRLHSWGVLTTWDLGAFEILCIAHGTVRECDEELQTAGLLVHTESKNGQMIRKNPLVEIRDRAMAQYRQLAAHFGLTPLAREKVTGIVATSKREQEEDDWIAGRGKWAKFRK